MIILIPTHERPDMLLMLLKDIEREFGNSAKVKVYNDNSKADYSKVESYLKNFDHYYRRTNFNYGKKYFWKLTSIMYEDLLDDEFNYVIQLADDFRLMKGFKNELLKQFKASGADVLNFLVSRGSHEMWRLGNVPQFTSNGYTFWMRKWVDGAFITTRRMMIKIGYQCPEIPEWRFEKEKNVSSGVGSAMSSLFHINGGKIMITNKSLVDHRGMESKMNPARTGDTTSIMHEL